MFRNRKFKVNTCHPSSISVRVVKSSVTSDGVEVCSVVNVPVSEEHGAIPSPIDYKLSDLLASGVPLTQLDSAIIDNGPSEEQVEQLNSALDKDSSNVESSNSEPHEVTEN